MEAVPTILPLDVNGRIYAIQDEKGNTIGTGSREVCEVLLHIMTQAGSVDGSGRTAAGRTRPNVRGAISM